MVYLQNIKFRGLYSFANVDKIELSNHVVIVGPNNSGKSNIMRIINILVDTFRDRQRLDYSKIYIHEHNPFLEVSLRFSEPETRIILDFFSFYLDDKNSYSQFFEFENYNLFLELFDIAKLRIEWNRTVEGESADPYVRLEFPKTGIKFFGSVFGDFCISNTYPEEHGKKQFNNEIRLKDLLIKISDKENAHSSVNEFYSDNFNEIGSVKIRINETENFSDKGRTTLTNLFSFLGLSVRSDREVRFLELLGRIFQKGIKISSGSKGLATKSLLEIASKLRTEDNEIVTNREGDKIHFNSVLERQIFEKTLDFENNLESDGSNLVSFLFSLKNSFRQSDRTKFKNIQDEFSQLFKSDKLSFDVILQYNLDEKYRGIWNRYDHTPPKTPNIMIQDDHLQMQFRTDQVGTGLLESIYLLTLAHGLENSVILLDEPAVNLHPTLMKSIIKSLQNPDLKNQFLIVTHSSELASYEIFDTKSSILYIRKKNHQSTVRTLDGKTKEWFSEKRHKLKHQIDSKIFFGKSILLCEGNSDKNLLEGITNSLEYTDSKIAITQNDVIITDVGGKKNFRKYIELMKNFDIPYLVLGDSDAKSLFEENGIMNKDDVTFKNNITIIENKDLECLMKDIDIEIYQKSELENKGSKPAIAFAFAEEISNNKPEKLQSVQKLLLESIKMAQGATQ